MISSRYVKRMIFSPRTVYNSLQRDGELLKLAQMSRMAVAEALKQISQLYCLEYNTARSRIRAHEVKAIIRSRDHIKSSMGGSTTIDILMEAVRESEIVLEHLIIG